MRKIVLILAVFTSSRASAQDFRFSVDSSFFDQTSRCIALRVVSETRISDTDTSSTLYRYLDDESVMVLRPSRIDDSVVSRFAPNGNLISSMRLVPAPVRPFFRREGNYYSYDVARRLKTEYRLDRSDTIGPTATWAYDTNGHVVRSWRQHSARGPDEIHYFEYANHRLLTERAYALGRQVSLDSFVYDPLGRKSIYLAWQGWLVQNSIRGIEYSRAVSYHNPKLHQRVDTVWQGLTDTDWYEHKPFIVFYDSVARYSEARQTPISNVFEWRRYWDSTGFEYKFESEAGTSIETKRFFLPNGLLQKVEHYSKGVLEATDIYRYSYQE